ncbi:MAG TPA: kelch repeat-containing protein [Candidatus Krumholzibacteria bacterium]|nr:kelch repeat-containing protein [Candidatus Krumholzibacteria bacterium]
MCALFLIRSSLAHAAADGAWRVITPPERVGQASVFDPVRDRMLVIGGVSASDDPIVYYDDVWELTLSGTPMWTLLNPEGPGPSGLGGRSAVYDPVGDRVIVFGGPWGADNTWELRLSPALEWNQLSFGGEPEGRTYHAAVYDSDEERMIIYGGSGCLLMCNDTWALSLSGVPEWTLLAVGNPGLRARHTMIYDANDDRVILYGGEPGLDDVWELSLTGAPTWNELSPGGTSPGGRYSHAAIHDAVRDRMLVYGGVGNCGGPEPPIGGRPEVGGRVSVDCTHVWELLVAGGSVEWAEFTPGGNHPGWRAGLSTIYDGPRDRMILYSGPGYDDLDYREIAALYLAEPETWGDLSPRARIGVAAIYDVSADALFGFGGASDGVARNDLWALSGNGETHGWTQLLPSGMAPFARSDAAAASDALRNRLIILGGTNGATDFGDVWAVDLDDPTGLVWQPVQPPELPPAPRSGHTADYDPSRDRVIVFGGRSGTMALGDVWTLSFGGMFPSWSPLATAGAPPPRFGHAALYDPIRDALLVFGGSDGPNDFNDAWALFFSSGQMPTWVLVPATGTPPAPRRDHGMLRDSVRDRLVIFGGTGGTSVLGDAWALTLSGTPGWEPLTPFGPDPGPRTNHAMVYDAQSDRALIFGGANATGSFSDVVSIAWGGVVGVQDRAPRHVGLLRVVPNPTGGAARVIIESAGTEPVRLAIYDVRGRLVREVLATHVPAGEHVLEWDGHDRRGEPVPGGVYFGRVTIGDRRFEAKIVVFR